MKIIPMLCILFIGVNSLTSCSVKGEKTRPPNVIFILADDMGFGDLGIMGHPYMKTPNLDRLAREGMLFSQYYTNASVCSPSRVALMTGLFPSRNNVHHIYTGDKKKNRQRGVPNFLDPDQFTVADLMKKAGYSTGHVGKWHLDGVKDSSTPDRYGFDSWLITNGLLQSPIYRERFASTEHDFTLSSGWIMEDGIDFIKKQQEEGKPFYLQLWTLVPHAPLNPAPRELAVYNGLEASPEDFSSWMRGYADSADDLTNQMKVFCASMTSLDAAIGRLLDYLDKAGLSENTLIFFASDNGPEDYHVLRAGNAGMGSTGDFRGRKRSIYEGGIRVPCIARWPGHIPAGKVNNSVISGVDWLPTLAKITGANLPQGYRPDGENISDIFNGVQRERQKPLFWEWRFRVAGNQDYFAPQLALRKGKWKFLCNPDGSRQELYDLQEDPGEENNLAERKPKRTEELKKILLDWKQTIPESAYVQLKRQDAHE